MSLADLNNLVNTGKIQDINVIIKADTDGSAQALRSALEKLSGEEVKVKVLEASVGAINDSDVLLAQASHAIIYGFNIRPDARIQAKAAEAKVEIRPHRIIYELIDEMTAAMKGLYKAEKVESVTGQVEVRHIYKITHVGTIAGSYVTSGLIKANEKVRLLREGVIVYEGQLASLKRFKDDVKEVKQGFECGLAIANFNDLKEGDIIEGYEMVDKK
jgi:translation initiation factor IF-2